MEKDLAERETSHRVRTCSSAQTFFCSIDLSYIFAKEMNFASQVTFTTDSDCEVLLHLYKEYGPHFLKKVKQIWIVPPSHHLYSYI